MEQCKALIDQINNLFIVIGTIGTMGSTVMLLLADRYVARFSYQHIEKTNAQNMPRCDFHLQDLLWIMHCAKEAKGLKHRPPRRMHGAGLGDIGGRLGTGKLAGKQLTTPALNTREVPRTSHGRASSRRTGRSSTYCLDSTHI